MVARANLFYMDAMTSPVPAPGRPPPDLQGIQTFFYRHGDLFNHIHALASQPPNPHPGAVSRASLQADLHAAQARCARYAARVQQLECRLSELMGEQTQRTSGLGAPDDIDQLHRRITALGAEVADVRSQLGERTDELHATRLANRELMTRLNLPRPTA